MQGRIEDEIQILKVMRRLVEQSRCAAVSV
jgi:hypothetical protein